MLTSQIKLPIHHTVVSWTLKRSSQQRYTMEFSLNLMNMQVWSPSWPKENMITSHHHSVMLHLPVVTLISSHRTSSTQWRCFCTSEAWIHFDGFTALPADGALSTSLRRSFCSRLHNDYLLLHCGVTWWIWSPGRSCVGCFFVCFCRCHFGPFTATVWVSPLLAGLCCLVHLWNILTWSFAEHCSTVYTLQSSAITLILLFIILCIIHYLLLLFVEAQHNILDFFFFFGPLLNKIQHLFYWN